MLDTDPRHVTDFRHENRDNPDMIMTKIRDMNSPVYGGSRA
jgi:hypothetical protein